MQKEEIKVSELYNMKVGKNTMAVRIMSYNQDGHWVGRNIKTNNDVLIKSAKQLVSVYHRIRPKAAMAEKKVGPAKATSKKEGSKLQISGLSGAVQILQEAGQPLNCREMVKRMLDKGLWKTDGKTPSATLHSAISTEIKKKGAESRFRKTGRGKFEFAK
ncbi:MAG: hypothetical protein A2Y10_18025 [Planctomycetes bacterium GWF2_41_51]|nr:MAG: hypothetical protein A2Y10_18025 [Planctomycetes bacterium GWF2_41_51]